MNIVYVMRWRKTEIKETTVAVGSILSRLAIIHLATPLFSFHFRWVVLPFLYRVHPSSNPLLLPFWLYIPIHIIISPCQIFCLFSLAFWSPHFHSDALSSIILLSLPLFLFIANNWKSKEPWFKIQPKLKNSIFGNLKIEPTKMNRKFFFFINYQCLNVIHIFFRWRNRPILFVINIFKREKCFRSHFPIH